MAGRAGTTTGARAPAPQATSAIPCAVSRVRLIGRLVFSTSSRTISRISTGGVGEEPSAATGLQTTFGLATIDGRLASGITAGASATSPNTAGRDYNVMCAAETATFNVWELGVRDGGRVLLAPTPIKTFLGSSPASTRLNAVDRLASVAIVGFQAHMLISERSASTQAVVPEKEVGRVMGASISF